MRERRELNEISIDPKIVRGRVTKVFVVEFQRNALCDLSDFDRVGQPIAKEIGLPGKQLGFALKASKGRTVHQARKIPSPRSAVRLRGCALDILNY